MGVAAHQVHAVAVGKRLVGLVHHHQTLMPSHRLDQARDHRLIPQIGGRVVRVGQVEQRGLVLVDGRQHRRLVELEVGRQWHADETHPLQACRQAVHHEAGQRRHEHRARHGTSQAQQADQLVRAVAQHQRAALGQPRMRRQCGLQVVTALGRVTVDRHPAQPIPEFALQRFGQAVWVFHRVDLDQPRTGLDRIAVQTLDVGADHALHAGLERVHGVASSLSGPTRKGLRIRTPSICRSCGRSSLSSHSHPCC